MKSILFKAYISIIYTSQIWRDYQSDVYSKFSLAYNKCFRALFRLDRRRNVSQEIILKRLDTNYYAKKTDFPPDEHTNRRIDFRGEYIYSDLNFQTKCKTIKTITTIN